MLQLTDKMYKPQEKYAADLWINRAESCGRYLRREIHHTPDKPNKPKYFHYL